jgi:glycosyltransferase involved in cell wall biosynthesis
VTESTPLVSVVIAAFNAEPYIEDACRSVLQQTYASIELIVVDDGSTDRTADIVRNVAGADQRVRLIRQSNGGVAAARNRAIAEASGEFIAPLDADDVWAPAKLERQVRRLQDGGEQTGLAYCWWAWIDEGNEVLDRSPRWDIEGCVWPQLIEVNFTGGASVPMFRRICVQELGGYSVTLRDAGSGGCEDWDLALRVAERYQAAVVPAVLVGYRRHAANMSANYGTMWRSHSRVLMEFAERHPMVPRDRFRRSRAQFALHLAGVAFWSGDYLEACRWSIRARHLTLGLGVLPHATRLFVRRLLHADRSKRRLNVKDGAFDEAVLAEPLIPYDRIYARHWESQPREQTAR